MGNPLDRDVAHLAASVLNGMNQHINSNTTTSQRDAEILNPARLDINQFLPEKHRRPGGFPNHPQQQHPPQGNPQQQQHNIPPQQQQNFAPIPLPSQPSGYIPMDETAKKYAEQAAGFKLGEAPTEFEKPDVSGPTPTSFQNTEFTSVTKPSSAKSSTDIPMSVQELLENNNKELIQLKKKVGTLSTRLYKVLKMLEDKEKEKETGNQQTDSVSLDNE